ncbi:hypothetical protein, conserved [Eimeria maxima]|uniref:Uncharacterized protein n=1 Tax=Eimeria maxima TaxID=5804 RepID=U6M9Z5_EIMMA|nr:hypothetical protein, conserved [Eimeria maxima]CDJ58480.1 hypothetical protein, conserved [Eimeria maxima]
MERQQKGSICSLAYGSLAEAGATVDTHLLELCRPHYKVPSALLPVAKYGLPHPQSGAGLRSFRGVNDVLFTPYCPSLLLACTPEGTILTFDMNHEAFISEMPVAGEPGDMPNPNGYAPCVHVNRDPNTPLLFSGSPNGDVMVFDSRISGVSAKLLGPKLCPILRLPSAHDGALCGIGTGVALHPQLFLTGGREDRWIRVFDLRFPFHYSSGGSGCGIPTPYPLEAKRLGPSEQDRDYPSLFMTFDVSPDGSLLAASVTRYRPAENFGIRGMLEGSDGETILISLPDGLRAIKTIASADGCAADFVQFSPNAKYILQTGGSCRQRFWDHLLRVQGSKAVAARADGAAAKEVLQFMDSDTQHQAGSVDDWNQVSESSTDNGGSNESPAVSMRGAKAPATTIRLYEGLKLWDSTTGVVLSWAEGELASEDTLRCIAPLPDVSSGLLVTGGYVPSDFGKMRQSASSAGLTFWSLQRRDDLLMAALDGSFSLEVQLNDESPGGGDD